MKSNAGSAVVFLTLLLLAGAAQAGPITSITISGCDLLQGCQGSSLFLSVEDNENGTWTVLQSIDSTGFNEVRDGLNQIGFKAIKDWTLVDLISAPDPGWLDPPKEANISANSLCGNGGTTDKVCTHGFTDITVNDSYTWEFLVTGGTLMDSSEWHWGGQYANDAEPVSGKIISASAGGPSVPEPNAAVAFGLGALLVGRSVRRHRR